MRLPSKLHMWLVAVMMVIACDSNSPAPVPSKPALTITMASVRVAATANSPVASTPSVAAAAPRKVTVASLREDAATDISAFDGKPVTLDAYFVQVAQKQYGTGEHPRHYFAKVDIALRPLAANTAEAPDTLACYYRERSWPPQGLSPGDPIQVTGRWSFAQLLSGGWRPGGGPLHVAACRVKWAASGK